MKSLPFSHPDEVAQPLQEGEEVVEAAGELDLDRLGRERIRRCRAPSVELPLAPGWIWSKQIPESCASALSWRMTSGVWSWVGIAIARRKTDAERTAGSACVKAVERLLAICACTAAVCFFRLAAVERFGAITAK